ncbi:unnamed protein product [Lepeophtheirus salmonis]|uniref:Spondin-1 n=1 Tax=Lepeophtheirus salmonis TaxID=72036 RepID=A0A7R8CGU9_LEPSM|nr:unnamed protein product [Lepeophtheirus salmonis]CAF2818486.1 unnamed protein product [Lepeophtheirus salmonis]
MGFQSCSMVSPRLYRPHQTYTITLGGWRDEMVVKFQDFILVAEPALTYAHTQWRATSSISKKNIQVHWIAPRRNSGCISFKAMVIERPGIWFMDDGALSYTVCEDSSALAEPQNVDPCCACNEAKYEIVFQGIWSRHTHPKNFPEDEWRTQFSTLIGASHSSNFSIWDYGEIASSALQELGENGITRPLESQMKQYSHTIRSVIKAHGLQQRSNVEGQTLQSFRVDKIHHLLSVVSKMIPSPDFIVGVSKENLCLSNCSWVPYRVVDLYPWDIGTDSGITYNDPPNPQRPKDIIKRITSNYPNDPKSPFFDISGAPIKPAARLHIIRQKTYKRSNCPLEMGYQTSSNPMNPSWINTFSKETNNNKKMTQNSFYQEDSTTLEQNNNNRSNKNIPLRFEFTGSSIHESSANNDIHSVKFSDNVLIPESNEDKNELYDNISCKKTEWEDWSKCSRTCGFGSRLRLRQFVNHSASKNSNCVDKNVEKEVCQNLPICSATRYGVRGIKMQTLDISYVNHNINPNFINHEEKQSYEYPPRFDYMVKKLSYDEKSSKEMDCSLTNYGPWSDCSVSCGKGSKTRIRRYKEPSKSFECTKELYQINDCISNFCYGHQNSVYILKNKINNNKYNSSNKNPSCKISEWSSWSPCSKKCNQGYKIRTRLYLIPFVPNRSCDVKLMDRLNCNDAGLKCSSTASKDFDIFEDFTIYVNSPLIQDLAEVIIPDGISMQMTIIVKSLNFLDVMMPMDQPLNDIYSKKSECKFEKWTQWSECVSPCRRIGWRSRIRKKKFVTHSSRCSNRIFEKKKCINTVDCFKLDHSRWYQAEALSHPQNGYPNNSIGGTSTPTFLSKYEQSKYDAKPPSSRVESSNFELFHKMNDWQLTSEQVNEFKEVFKLFDKDEDGVLTFSELNIVMKSLGQRPKEEELLKMVRDVSEDPIYDTIEFNEFLQMMSKQQKYGLDEESIKEAFK